MWGRRERCLICLIKPEPFLSSDIPRSAVSGIDSFTLKDVERSPGCTVGVASKRMTSLVLQQQPVRANAQKIRVVRCYAGDVQRLCSYCTSSDSPTEGRINQNPR